MVISNDILFLTSKAPSCPATCLRDGRPIA